MPKYELITKESFLDYYLSNKGAGFKYNEDEIFRYIDEGIDAVCEADMWDPVVALINIDNYQGELPKDFTRVIQVLYKPVHSNKDKVKRAHIVEYTRELFGTNGCQLRINVECPKCHNLDCDCKTSVLKLESAEAEFRFPEIVANLTRASRVVSTNPESPFYVHFNHRQPQWQWIRPAQNHFFNHSYHVGDCINYHIETNVEYKIQPPVIIVNEPKAQILMAALVTRKDEDGYRLIPNVPIVLRLLDTWVECYSNRQKWLRMADPINERMRRALDQERLALLRTARAEINALDPDEQEAYMSNFFRKWFAPVDNMKQLGRMLPEKYQNKR